MNRPSVNEIINQIRNWQIEVHSDRNDGWTKAHYMIQLNKIRDALEDDPYEIPYIPGFDLEESSF